MKRNITQHLVASVVLGLFSCMVGHPSYAGLDQEMNTMFQSMVNVTPPSYVGANGGQRGVIAGGSLEARARIVSPQFVNFTPPSVKAGCGGISVFGGSFSFINAQQLEQLLRSIAQNASGYAFNLAMQVMCPTCASEMAKLQRMIQSLNGVMGNSCQAAQGLVNTFAPGLKAQADAATNDAASQAVTGGVVTDFAQAIGWTDNTNPNPYQNAANAGKTAQLTSNIVWDSLQSANAATWFSQSQDGSMNPILMSLTGTMVANDATTTDGSNEKTIAYTYQEATIGIRDILEGGSLQIYTCATADPQCLHPTKTTQQITGMRQRVTDMLLGAGGNPGIVDALLARAGASPFNAQQLNFLEASASTGILPLLRGFREDPAAARATTQFAIDAVASQMATQIVADALFTVRSAVGASGKNMDQKMLAELERREQEIQDEQERLASYVKSIESVYTVAEQLRAKLRQTGGRASAERGVAANQYGNQR